MVRGVQRSMARVLCVGALFRRFYSSTPHGHSTFIKDVAATIPPEHLPHLLKMLQIRGDVILPPGEKQGLFPLTIPLSRSSSSGVTIALLRWPTIQPEVDLPVVEIHKHGVQLLAKNVDQYIHRLLVEEDALNYKESTTTLYDASAEAGKKLYSKGDFVNLDTFDLDAYLLRKVGVFPDVLERKILQHLDRGDVVSALVTGEFYTKKKHFPGFGRPFAFNAEVLMKIGEERLSLIEKSKLGSGICFDPEDHLQVLQSSVDILVATPGRLMDHINTTKGFTLEHLQYLVVDEMDRLLREAYQSCLPTVLKLTQSNNITIFPSNTCLPSPYGPLRTIRRCGIERGFRNKPSPRLCKIVLSATLTQDPGRIAQLDLHHPLLISSKRYGLPETLESYEVICEDNKPLHLMALLKNLDGEKCIVFTSTKDSTRKLHDLLSFCGLQIKIQKYSGVHRQAERSKVLKAFRKGEVQVLISTDAMTRGMDVEGVRNVINYDVPDYIKTYIHRAGRTARAGESGRCFTLLLQDEVEQFKEVLQKAENHHCASYSLSPDSIESLHPCYVSALEKLKKSVSKKRKRKNHAPATKTGDKKPKDHAPSTNTGDKKPKKGTK